MHGSNRRKRQEIIRRVAGWLRPEYDRIQQRIRRADVVYVDETGMKVDGKQHWIWVFATDSEILVAIRGSRGKKVLREILGPNFKGTLVCDGWKSYPNFTSRIQRCWAHLLRGKVPRGTDRRSKTPLRSIVQTLQPP